MHDDSIVLFEVVTVVTAAHETNNAFLENTQYQVLPAVKLSSSASTFSLRGRTSRRAVLLNTEYFPYEYQVPGTGMWATLDVTSETPYQYLTEARSNPKRNFQYRYISD